MRLLIIISLITVFSATAHARFWYVPPVISYGEMKKSTADDNIPRYKQGTTEYGVLQLSLDIENLLPTYIDPQYEKIFLDNIPPALHTVVKSRNKRYADIKRLKDEGSILENSDGLLKTSNSVAPAGIKDMIKDENADRTEMFAKMCANYKLAGKDCEIVSTVYAQGVKNHKYYALIEENSSKNVDISSSLTSMASNYNYRKVWMALISILKSENLTVERTDSDDIKGIITPHYLCNGKEKRSFVLKLCAVKNQKLVDCIHQKKETDGLYAPIQDGTMIWVENDSSKSLITAEAKEQEEIYMCKGSSQKFELLEKLSIQLLANDDTRKKSKTSKTTRKK
jgi:hypothetical protein